MGFMDKAKQMAEQAQQKIDETQKKFNEGQQQGQQQPGEAPAVEYDSAGRPIQADAPQQPVAPAPSAPAPAAEEPRPAPGPPPSGSMDAPEGEDSPNEPPKMSSGDPLAG